MSQTIGILMIASGATSLILLSLKIFAQPFIPEDLLIQEYFPSTELVLGIPILCGTVFSVAFGIYIFKLLLRDSFSSSQ